MLAGAMACKVLTVTATTHFFQGAWDKAIKGGKKEISIKFASCR